MLYIIIYIIGCSQPSIPCAFFIFAICKMQREPSSNEQ